MSNRHIQSRDYEENPRDLPAEGLQILDWEFSHMPGSLAPFREVESGILTARGYYREVLLIPHWRATKALSLKHRILSHPAFVLHA